jgi:hypothetical protein
MPTGHDRRERINDDRRGTPREGPLALANSDGASRSLRKELLENGVKANFATSLDPLAIRALLIHTAEPGHETQAETGWGRVRSDIDDIVVCPDGSFRVVYQGELTASKYLRAEIPLPDEALRGFVRISATC